MLMTPRKALGDTMSHPAEVEVGNLSRSSNRAGMGGARRRASARGLFRWFGCCSGSVANVEYMELH